MQQRSQFLPSTPEGAPEGLSTGSDAGGPQMLCPFVGVADDPDTAFSFPVSANHCHRTEPPASVKAIHQQTYCLSGQYTTCPIYRQKTKVALPGRRRLQPDLRDGLVALLANAAPASLPRVDRARLVNVGRKVAIPLLVLGAGILILVLGWEYRQAMTAVVRQWGTATPVQPAAIVPGSTADNGAVMGDTAKPSATPLPATPTPTAPVATSTSSSVSPTPGSILVTALPTATAPPTATASSTATASPAAAQTEAPTATAGATTSINATSPVACGPPPGWVLYVVQPSDNLFRLSLRYGVSISQLQVANCLGDSEYIYSGQRIYVPYYLPPTAAPSPVPTDSPPAATSLPPTATPPRPPADTAEPSATPPLPTPTPPEADVTPVPLTATPPPAAPTATPITTLVATAPALITPTSTLAVVVEP